MIIKSFFIFELLLLHIVIQLHEDLIYEIWNLWTWKKRRSKRKQRKSKGKKIKLTSFIVKWWTKKYSQEFLVCSIIRKKAGWWWSKHQAKKGKKIRNHNSLFIHKYEPLNFYLTQYIHLFFFSPVSYSVSPPKISSYFTLFPWEWWTERDLREFKSDRECNCLFR